MNSNGTLFNAETEHARLTLTSPKQRLKKSKDDSPLALLDQGMRTLQTLYENHHFYPKMNANGDESRDDLLYYRLAEMLVPGFWGNMFGTVKPTLAAGQLLSVDKFDLKDHQILELNTVVEGLISRGVQNSQLELLNRYSEARNWFAQRPDARNLPEQPKRTHEKIQVGLKESLPDVNVSRMLLLRIDNKQGGRNFLKEMETLLWPADDGVYWNLSITHAGLRAIGIKEELRQQFPKAFRDGMANRAGLLGDIGVNNPREWNWPKCNWALAQGKLVPGANTPIFPDSIDIIGQVQNLL